MTINYFILCHCPEWIDLIRTDQEDDSVHASKDFSAIVFEHKEEILKSHL